MKKMQIYLPHDSIDNDYYVISLRHAYVYDVITQQYNLLKVIAIFKLLPNYIQVEKKPNQLEFKTHISEEFDKYILHFLYLTFEMS